MRKKSQTSESGGATGLQSPGGIMDAGGDLYRLLVESVEDYAIFALDPDGYILSWNPGAERFKGYRAEEVIGKHFSIFYPAKQVADRFPEYELREAARTGRFEDEGWRIRKDGTTFWANVVLTALHDPSGRLVGFAKVTRDLTERRAAEVTLRESEQRFRLLIQGVKDYAIFMLDPTGHVATWNEGAERIKGYSAAEIIGQHFSKFYLPEEVASGKPERELEIAAATGKYEEEGWRVRKDGGRLWASVTISALRDDDGTLVGFAKVTRDLTERRAGQERALDDARRIASNEIARQAAERARKRAETLQALTSALSSANSVAEIARIVVREGVVAAGADAGALAIVDKASRRIQLAGIRGFDALPAWATDIGYDDHMPISAAVRSGTAVVIHSRAERDARYPELRDVLASFGASAIIPLTIRERVIGAFAVYYRDESALTEDSLSFVVVCAQQVGQAIERARLYEEQIAQTAERERLLAAERQSRARADEANRAKSQFLAAMSHELRTPLNAIGGYADLIDLGLRGPVTDEQHVDIQRIKRSQKHLLGIINDILNFARVEAGQLVYQLEPVAFGDVIQSVGQMIAPQAAAKGVRLTIADCPDNLVAWADRSKVEQIILNLLSNAVKFTMEGDVTLSCNGARADRVEITVGDTGNGIGADQLERIFEPFIQVGRSLTASHEGTGLGLAISRDLARAMGGDITVTSALGEGSKFTLAMPRTAP